MNKAYPNAAAQSLVGAAPNAPAMPPAAEELLAKLERMNERAAMVLSRMDRVVGRAFGEGSTKRDASAHPKGPGLLGHVKGLAVDLDETLGALLDACDHLDRIV